MRPLMTVASSGALAGRALQWSVGLCVAAGFLAFVARHVGGGTGQVVLHVVESDVEVTIGPVRLTFEDRIKALILVDLPPGRHDLRVCRGPSVLLSQSFDLPRGGSVVLSAHDDRKR